MPALSSPSSPPWLAARTPATGFSSSAAHNSSALQVVCAWPVSGQYGPGSRVLYYVLVAACVFARKAEWLRNACLAAALLFPAVAAVHGIVLAAVHVNGAIDLDIYGAFQLCSIGILAAPLTVRVSRTYFYDPGRNAIFVWTGIILAGLLSLTVEFYRVTPTDCTHDDNGNPISNKISGFPYEHATCNLACSVEQGPHSPMRGGSANNIYVVPLPNRLSANIGMLLAAACCIPAILSLIFMLEKILEINWKIQHGGRNEEAYLNEPITGTNGATVGRMKGVNSIVQKFLSVVEIPLFAGAVLAILIIGEINFFSPQLRYQTEPMASIGQWAPIAGTFFAVLGAFYLRLTTDGEVWRAGGPWLPRKQTPSPIKSPTRQPTVQLQRPDTRLQHDSADDAGNRRMVAKRLNEIGDYLGTAAHDKFDISHFRRGPAIDFPEVPGEEQRNAALPQIRELYNSPRDADGNVTPSLRPVRSREGSFTSMAPSGFGMEAMSTASGSGTRERSSASFELEHRPSTPRVPARRNTLQVPSPTHRT